MRVFISTAGKSVQGTLRGRTDKCNERSRSCSGFRAKPDDGHDVRNGSGVQKPRRASVPLPPNCQCSKEVSRTSRRRRRCRSYMCIQRIIVVLGHDGCRQVSVCMANAVLNRNGQNRTDCLLSPRNSTAFAPSPLFLVFFSPRFTGPHYSLQVLSLRVNLRCDIAD
jgi:hypothetical protein